ncbi:PC4 and SFRS1-interacting protein-like [Corticium candelabrum]|uniref:PC4 and SFRS1-interacting protein-like n=1 Tax=Corticium candelabrum TaxID=121492 RepID=UPI002E25923D|nr:PC4 and SFRS1-interacting protein-like [Corticium candelabrum]
MERTKCESGYFSGKELFSFEDHKTKYNKPLKNKGFLEALNEIENNPDIKDLNELSDEDGSSGSEDYQQEKQIENNPDIEDPNELSDEDGSSGNEDYQQEKQQSRDAREVGEGHHMHPFMFWNDSRIMKRRKRRPPPPTRLPVSKPDAFMMKIHNTLLNKPEAYAVRVLRLQVKARRTRRCTCIQCKFMCKGQQSWAATSG